MNKKGFTLMELMVVVIIMAALASISYPVYTKAISKARIAEAISLVQIVREAQLRHKIMHNSYFSNFTDEHKKGKNRLIKSGSVNVSYGKLIKDGYTVMISSASGTGEERVPNGCIVVEYRDNLFTIYAHVEDNKIWCNNLQGEEICNLIPSLEPANTNNCV